MALRLENKLCIVTGGSRGIGAAIATAFARDGARVVITARKPDGLQATADAIGAQFPGRVHWRACHSGSAEAVADLVSWVEAELGVPDVLVNNAATNPYFGPLLGVSAAAWDKTFEVNLRGYFEATRQVAERWLARERGGSIVNIASIAGTGAAPLQGVYGMTKAAVISMTRTLAFELGPRGIRVNAIAPGLVDTRFASALTENPELARWFNERTALGRFAKPEEIAGAAVYLASDESSFVTGQVLMVDGGFSAA
jgi:NAD(P)-dependent dehydrogenase (short-subunit alcohol dehydrogenase family)